MCGNKDEAINRIIGERRKLALKLNKTWLDWVGMAIQCELCKKLKFYHTNKWYMRNPESVSDNETYKTSRLPYPGQKTRPRDN